MIEDGKIFLGLGTVPQHLDLRPTPRGISQEGSAVREAVPKDLPAGDREEDGLR
jgi:hypothetical protein